MRAYRSGHTASGCPSMRMAPGLRKIVLIAHIVSSVGSLGAVGGFLALAVAGLFSQDAQVTRSAYVAMEVIARFVILPLSGNAATSRWIFAALQNLRKI